MSQFIQQDEVESKLKFKQMFMLMWPFAKRAKLLGLSASVLMLLSILSARLLPQTIGYLIDHGILKKDAHVLALGAWVYLGLEISRTLCQFGYSYLFQKFGNRLLADLRADLMGHVQSLPLDYFHRNPVGRITTRLTNDPANLNDVFSDGVISIVANFLILISLIVGMFFISWKLTLFALFTTPFFVWLSIKVSNQMRLILRDSKKKLAELSSFASETLQGLKVLQILRAQKFAETKFTTGSEEYQNIILRSIRASALMQPVLNLFTAVLVASSLGAGGYLSIHDGLGIGSLVAFIMYSMDFIPPLREILEKYQRFQNSLTSGERVFQLFSEKPEEIADHKIELKNFSAHQQYPVEVKNLSFRYQPDQPLVLSETSLHIHPGDRVALIGRTGAGKSTLISLFQKFYEAPRGAIQIGDYDLADLPRAEIRKWIGVVQQDPVLFRGSMADNLGLNDPMYTSDEMKTALQKIGAWDYFAKTSRGLESWIEERGANFSLGERQLICFARIMIANPAFLILDEATANVDSETEALIQKAIQEMMIGRTCLIIAHRHSTLRDCNRFIEVQNGKMVEIDQVPVAGVKSTLITSVAPG